MNRDLSNMNTSKPLNPNKQLLMYAGHKGVPFFFAGKGRPSRPSAVMGCLLLCREGEAIKAKCCYGMSDPGKGAYPLKNFPEPAFI